MLTITRRARWAVTACAIGPLLLGGCRVKDKLLEPQNPGLVDPSAVGNAAAALALRVGAIGRIRQVETGGDERLWQEIGNITDEYKDADFQPSRQDIDRRTIATSNTDYPYTSVTQPRGFLRDAISAMNTFVPDSTGLIGELYMGLGFIEMSLAENYCNGIPLGHTDAGVVTLGPPLTNAQVFDTASTHLDSSLLVNTQSDPGSIFVRQASLILKARILVDKGQFAAAAALVPSSAVPTTYQYVFTTSPASTAVTEDNGHWQVQFSTARLTVGDSFDILNGKPNLIKNALPFVSANDPRVPIKKGAATAAEDGATPMYYSLLWQNRDDPIPMVSGIDARLIEAEAALNASDFAGMMTILNTLRSASQKIANTVVPVMPALAPPPTTKDAATTLFFREKAFWTFGRGQRLSDLRRLMRQYGRTEDNVFPTGIYSYAGTNGGTYGHDVNFPIPDPELVNGAFKGCIDRLP